MQSMTEEEIRRDVRLSANPKKQIKILAQINQTTPSVIRNIVNGNTWGEISDQKKGKKRCGRKTTFSDDEKQNIIELRHKGYKVKEIALMFHRPVGSISNILYR